MQEKVEGKGCWEAGWPVGAGVSYWETDRLEKGWDTVSKYFPAGA